MVAPESIPGGSNYTKSIPKAISDCKIFILILSSNAQKSLWVPAELEHAYKESKIIIPFDVENCSLDSDFDFLLSRCQRLNAYEKKSEALQKLINIIKSIIGADYRQAKNTVPKISNKTQLQNNNNSGKIKASLVLGWIGVFFDILLMPALFPATFIQTFVIVIGMILLSAKKYSSALWVIMIIASICSFAVFNFISILIISKVCFNKNRS
ncbi:MAG: toll/interleukin-1 receptor domain-containing protein [Eubacterium sp.]